MSDSNYSSPFHYPSSTDIPENEAIYGWMAPFSHPSFAHQGQSEMNQGLPEAIPSHPASLDRPMNPKVPIPRSANPAILTNRGRVSRACENCRDQKVKCSGHRPTCQRCQESGIQCSYGDRKREKVAKRLDDLTARIQSFETLLQNLYPNLDTQSAQYVEQALAEHNADSEQSSNLPVLSAASPLLSPDLGPPLGSVDFTNEDFNRDEIQAMGFVGGHSEIAWIHRLKQALDCSGIVSQGSDADHHSLPTANFFLDDSEVVLIEDVDLFQRPPIAIANHLVDSYFQVVHPSFPIIGKVTFLGQYKSFYSAPSVRPGKRWLAILNLVFAIASKHCLNISPETEITVGDPHIYFSRAWKLSMRDVSLLDPPNLQQVQVEGLASFHLMSMGQANRSWRLCGISLHSAVAMGLNLRNESTAISHSSRETRYRVWWSLHLLHISLCVITGRPPNNSEDAFTTPLPVPFIEEDFSEDGVEQLIADHEARATFIENITSGVLKSSVERKPGSPRHLPLSPDEHHGQTAPATVNFLQPNSSQHFLRLVELGSISRRSIEALYAPRAARKTWHYIEMAISVLSGRADSWCSKLPTEFHFTEGTPAFEQERLSLAFHFYSTKILITQPCLGRLVRRPTVEEPPESFCATTASMCIECAGQMLEALPDTPSLSWIYRVSPWWCIVHFIMQPTTILLTGLFLKGKVGSIKDPKLVGLVYKAVDWLAELAAKDASAQRAWQVCSDLISRHEIGIGFDSRKSG